MTGFLRRGVRRRVTGRRQREPLPVAHLLEHAEVESGTEIGSGPRQHHRPQPRPLLQRLAGVDERLEHRGVERVSLVRPVHPHLGDASVTETVTRSCASTISTPPSHLAGPRSGPPYR
ncbi:hypothetical protein C731_0693 [Mycolicibacterium hassiacum DSM 44199]|uniref:Uncharacterized protein n=1 Tax=Mycolicibacterium hassiacum (strain DSM 44199 / CIP 105218 / JCM 12690 / 3849) TaxID=1122247 RepID=K5BHW1_MYCHD|nr:hypothetical protein C731_0693 [Mycolicibacterium hassiacum DSM 44199]